MHRLVAALFLFSLPVFVFSQESSSRERFVTPGSVDWGIAVGFRNAEIPFNSDERKVSDFMALLYLNGEVGYLEGMEGGFYLYEDSDDRISLMTRYRFFDIPSEFQNEIQGGEFDFGFQYRTKHNNSWFSDFEILSDSDGNAHAHAKTSYYIQDKWWEVRPTLAVDWRSSGFNNRYYGFDLFDLGTGFGVTAGIEGRAHIWRNFYALARIEGNWVDSNTADNPAMGQQTQLNTFLGIAFFPTPQERSQPYVPASEHTQYIRVAHGVGTFANMSDIMLGWDWEPDPYNNKLTSVFYGRELTDDLFGIDLELYLHLGGVYHHSSEVQDTIGEGVVSFKFYYEIDWPTRWRIGFAEGISYASEVTYIEQTKMEDYEYRPSKLMNYLDVSIDVNMGDLLGTPDLEPLWVGWSLHHRSGIFEWSSAFSRIRGGSNYNTLYMQWEF